MVRERRPGDAFTAWVAPHIPDLRRFAVSLVGFDEADDLVQDCLGRAWYKHDLYNDSRGTAKGWLLSIMADQARRRWHRKPPDVHLVQPVTSVELDTARIDLRRAVDALPSRQRVAIVLYYYVDLTMADVATAMGCSLGTAKSTLHDARSNLQRGLGASYG